MTAVSPSLSFKWLVVPTAECEPPSKELIGGKAWSLWRMRSLGLRVPPAFVVTTEACDNYFSSGGRLPSGLADELRAGVHLLEDELDRRFGSRERAMLLSVRSGAAVSMPGMMDTVLNLGVNSDVEAAIATETGLPEFGAELHRRFCAFYGRLVLGCLEELDELDSAAVIKAVVADDTGNSIPDDPWDQLEAAVGAVFSSSRSRRAIAYRQHHGIRQDLATAVTIQAMVFGNLDEASGTGVLFTRNPLTGADSIYGEYLPRGQGEDVVSGRVTPQSLDHLAEQLPAVHAELTGAARLLDADGRDAQDIEFTVQSGVLYLLQSRAAKRTARAAVSIAVDLARRGIITPDEALERVSADQVRALLRPQLRAGAAAGAEQLAAGLSACPGAASGLAVATPEEAQALPGAILVRRSTSPEDIHGMICAAAVVTENGGSTSHAAVVSRALDTPCVVGCGEGAAAALIGRVVTVDATSGRVYAGELSMTHSTESDDADLRQLTQWARTRSPLKVSAPGGAVPGPTFESGADLETPPAIPEGTRSVSGQYFQTDAGVAAAVAARIETVVATQPLPILLAALAATRRSAP